MASPRYPIIIASKGRWQQDQAKTIKMLQKWHIDFYLACEKEEASNYSALTNNLLVHNTTGVGAARQFCLESARNMGAKAFWNLDDDVMSMQRKGEIVNPMKLFDYLEDKLDKEPNIGLIGPQYRQVVWRVSGLELRNKQCPCIVTLSRTNVPFDFDPNLRIGEDLDWMFKFCLNGWDTVVLNTWTFDAQKSHRFEGKVGGIAYTDEELDSSIEILEKRYPGIVKRQGDTFRRSWIRLQEAISEADVRRRA